METLAPVPESCHQPGRAVRSALFCYRLHDDLGLKLDKHPTITDTGNRGLPLAAALAVIGLFGAMPVLAAGTPAGTLIENHRG
jgi:hypothetical protein